MVACNIDVIKVHLMRGYENENDANKFDRYTHNDNE